MGCNLTDNQKNLLRWIVRQVREDLLPEEFTVVWIVGGRGYIILEYKGKKENLIDLTMGMLDALSTAKTLHCTAFDNQMSRSGERESLRKCVLTESAYEAVDSNFDSSNTSTSQNAISILFFAADPTDQRRLRLGEELREIREKMQLAKLRERFELHERASIRPEDISQALLDIHPQIVHFSGHGMTTGELCFEDKLGNTQPIQSDALAALFEQFANEVKCVILNACYSESQAQAIAEHINYVIGMNQAIGDEAAIAFAIGFYQALGAGRSFEDAYKLGCVQVRLQNIPEYLTPILIKRTNIS